MRGRGDEYVWVLGLKDFAMAMGVWGVRKSGKCGSVLFLEKVGN
jgi:hypothetical protein